MRGILRRRIFGVVSSIRFRAEALSRGEDRKAGRPESQKAGFLFSGHLYSGHPAF
jgi:hypothetical protein